MKIRVVDPGFGEPPYILTEDDVIMLDVEEFVRVLRKHGVDLEAVFSDLLGFSVDKVEVLEDEPFEMGKAE